MDFYENPWLHYYDFYITATPQPLALALVALVAAKVLLPLMITHHQLLVVVPPLLLMSQTMAHHLILSQPLLLL